LLLDEPTNHLDLAGINWVEAVLRTARFASIIVSHDRYLLENVATSVVELNRIYDGGLFRVNGRYSDFLEARDAFLASDGRRTESLANRVRSEVSWLRRGPKARGTKAQARVDNAQRLIDELGELKARRGGGRAGIDFSATVRRTRRLIELKDVGCAVGGRRLFGNIDLEIGPGTRLGVVGPNGSGKTTLLRLVRGDLAPTEGTVGRADPLRIVYFDQSRDLDPNLTLRRTLAPDQDSVVYQDRAIHVRSWASRFLFSDDDLDQPVGRLSGGERARVLIAQLMLEPADVLLLDEPTNDLDIPTLEVLEDRLNEFAGAMILVTHDRHMMDLVATRFLGFDGAGGSGIFAGYTQWERWLGERESPDRNAARTKASPGPSPGRNSKKLGYMEAREYAGIPDRIEEADARLEALRASMSSPEVATDAERLLTLWADIVALERRVEQLYARWEELQRKQD
jgi:ATP-binding cassette subfamily F protein uup